MFEDERFPLLTQLSWTMTPGDRPERIVEGRRDVSVGSQHVVAMYATRILADGSS